METKQFVGSSVNVILTRQICGQRSSRVAESKHQTLENHIYERICYMFLISKCRGDWDFCYLLRHCTAVFFSQAPKSPGLFIIGTVLISSLPPPDFGFWFLVWYAAATRLATQLQQRCTQVVCSNKEAQRRLTESNGTPAMDFGHMNVGWMLFWSRHSHTQIYKQTRNRAKHTSIIAD